MGIQGLLQGLKFVSSAGNIIDYKGQAVCVDGSSWLHKSVYSIAENYVECTERGGLDQRSIRVASSYINKRCEELLKYAKIRKIYFVLDGKRCPLKTATNTEREKRRQENLADARRLKEGGDSDDAIEKYKACIKISERLTKEVASNLAVTFSSVQVQVVQAPYEADPQLVKLCVDGHCSAIITEDSDVLVYCAAARHIVPVLFKLDRKSGQCQVVSMAWLICSKRNLSLKTSLTSQKKKKTGIETTLEVFAARELKDPGFGARLFVQACVLAGCDYAANQLEGVGLVNAFKAIRGAMHREDDDRFRHSMSILPPKACRDINKIDYEELLAKSEAIFYHHPVIETDGSIVYFTATSRNDHHFPSIGRFGGDLSFIGSIMTGDQQSLPFRDRTNEQFPPPMAEIAVQDRANHELRRRRSKTSFEDGLKQAKLLVPLLNPYMNPKKRTSNGEEKDAEVLILSQARQNPFASFMATSKRKKNVSELEKCRSGAREIQRIPSAANRLSVSAYLQSLPLPSEGKTLNRDTTNEAKKLTSQLDMVANDNEGFMGGGSVGVPCSRRPSEPPYVAEHTDENNCGDYLSNQEKCLPFPMLPNLCVGRNPSLGGFDTSPMNSHNLASETYSSRSDHFIKCIQNHSAIALDSTTDITDERFVAEQPCSKSPRISISDYNLSNQHTCATNSEKQSFRSAVNGILSMSQDDWAVSGSTLPVNKKLLPRRVTSEVLSEVSDVEESTIHENLLSVVYSPPKRSSIFEYDDWLASPQTGVATVNAVEHPADGIVSSPDAAEHNCFTGLVHRNSINTTRTIGVPKVFRNRFQSTGAGNGLLSYRTKRGKGLIQGKLSRFFSKHG